MKALIVVSEAPPIVSGVSRTVERLSNGLTELGVDVDIVSSNEIRRWMFGEVRISSLIAHWLPLARRLSQYDVINLHGPAPTMSDTFLALFQALPRLTRPALVYTHHSSIDIAGLGALCRVYDAATARLATLTDRIIVTTESYAGPMRRPGGPPVDVVPWGVDAQRFRPKTDAPSEGPLRVLFVGQLRPYKGVSGLLKAVCGQPELSLTIVGSGPLGAKHRQEAVQLGASNVTFKGRVSDQELESLYADHDVIVLPSTTRAEAFGLVLLEGMASRCVPVASDLPGVRDVASPTGVLVKPGDVGQLRQALLGLARDRARLNELATSSRVAALQHPWEAVAVRYERSFSAAIEGAHVRRGSAILRAPFLQPDESSAWLARRFDANWWSLMVFHGRPARRAPIAWGRAAHPRFHREEPRIAQYVASEQRPVLLDSRSTDGDVRSLLTRRDVGSAMAVPIPLRRGTLGVLSLSVAAASERQYTRSDLADLMSLVAT